MSRVGAILVLFLASAAAPGQSQSHIDEAKKLLDLMNVDDAIEQSYDQIYGQLTQMADQLEVTEEQRPIFDHYMEKMVSVMKEELSWERMEPYILQVYVDVYSEQELRELNEFYASPVGQKFVAKMPELMQASMEMTQSMLQNMIPRITEIQEEMIAELRPEPTAQ